MDSRTGQREFRTECLDTAMWLLTKGFTRLRMEASSARHRGVWVFDDPEGKAQEIVCSYLGSEVHASQTNRKSLMTEMKEFLYRRSNRSARP